LSDETTATLHLASRSPRRRQILDALGVPYTCAGVDVEEQPLPGEAARDMVLRLARAKAAAANVAGGRAVLGADTAVVLDGEIFGKPADRDDGLGMLARLSGHTHAVLTGVALQTAQGVMTALSISEVRFRDIGRDEALAYWQSGEPCDKAGAYAIQGRGGIFVAEIRGSYSGVVGLPVFETAQLLKNAGVPVLPRG
jgi:nucleoside triphosphate pyrophosphatase